jgi:hypothetical protein
MDSTTFFLLSKSNSKIDGSKITFGTVDFQSHPPTLAEVFASLDQEMDLTIGSLNFRVGSLGSLRLSDPIPLGPWAGKTIAATTSENFCRIVQQGKPAARKRNIVDELDEIMENLDPKESSNYSDMESEGNSYSISNYTQKRTSPLVMAMSFTTLKMSGCQG